MHHKNLVILKKFMINTINKGKSKVLYIKVSHLPCSDLANSHLVILIFHYPNYHLVTKSSHLMITSLPQQTVSHIWQMFPSMNQLKTVTSAFHGQNLSVIYTFTVPFVSSSAAMVMVSYHLTKHFWLSLPHATTCISIVAFTLL